jgi:hypothetical protein
MTNGMHKFLIYLSVFFCLTCFELSFSSSSELSVQLRQWFKSRWYDVSSRPLTPDPGDFIHRQICTPASEDELKESSKHVRKKKTGK